MKKYITPIFCTLLFVGSITYNIAFASSFQPGTTDDPVVTKSYVDKKVQEVSGGATLSDYQLEFIISEVTNNIKSGDGGVSVSSAGAQYTPVNVLNGQVVLGDEGTEIILRSGSAVGYTVGINGLVNATDGAEIENGTQIKINNLLIVPRNDGRGVRATSNTWLLIKGGYEIVG